MAKYKFRFFVDNDASLILWSADEATKEKYGYDVFYDELPISKNLSKI